MYQPNALETVWRRLSSIVSRWFRKPPSRPALQDTLLGTLSWDPELELYSGGFGAEYPSVQLTLYPDAAGSIEPALDRAREVISQLDRYRQAAADYSAAHLLSLKNESWLNDVESELTAEDFKSRMRLESLVFYDDYSVVFLHDDGDLFRGHCIEVHMNAMGDFDDANISG